MYFYFFSKKCIFNIVQQKNNNDKKKHAIIKLTDSSFYMEAKIYYVIKNKGYCTPARLIKM